MDDLLLLKMTFRKSENCSWMRNHQPRFFPSIKTNIWSDHFSITWLLVSWCLIDLRSSGNTCKFNWCITHTCLSKPKQLQSFGHIFIFWNKLIFQKLSFSTTLFPVISFEDYTEMFPFWTPTQIPCHTWFLSYIWWLFEWNLFRTVLHKETEAIKSNKKLRALRLISHWLTIQWIPFATVILSTLSHITFISTTMKVSHLNNPHSTYSSQKYNIQSICTTLASHA